MQLAEEDVLEHVHVVRGEVACSGVLHRHDWLDRAKLHREHRIDGGRDCGRRAVVGISKRLHRLLLTEHASSLLEALLVQIRLLAVEFAQFVHRAIEFHCAAVLADLRWVRAARVDELVERVATSGDAWHYRFVTKSGVGTKAELLGTAQIRQ